MSKGPRLRCQAIEMSAVVMRRFTPSDEFGFFDNGFGEDLVSAGFSRCQAFHKLGDPMILHVRE